MSEKERPLCPECAGEGPEVDRRDFIRVAGGTAAAVALAGVSAPVPARAAGPARPRKPAEDLVRELYASLSADQKKQVVRPWDYAGRRKGGRPLRLGMYNGPIEGVRIGSVYTRKQQELLERILKAISSGEDGYRRISRMGRFDGSGSLQGCGAMIFGDPTACCEKFAWVFAGHHLTVRCDGNSEEGAAFGGPMYYGHSPYGYSRGNIFYYQTRSVLKVYDALSEGQRGKALIARNPGEGPESVRFKSRAEERPGVRYADLTKDQKGLVEGVMRDLLSPFRREDADEVMEIVGHHGGLDKIQLAFYADREPRGKEAWHFWRLEGPGFVWNYRVLPHVHCYVNISSKV
jgi:hypothetical protein